MCHSLHVPAAPPCTTLHYPALPCTTLHYPAQPYTSQHYPTLPSNTQNGPTIPYSAWHYPALPCTTLHHPARPCATSLHCTTLPCTIRPFPRPIAFTCAYVCRKRFFESENRFLRPFLRTACLQTFGDQHFSLQRLLVGGPTQMLPVSFQKNLVVRQS